MSSTRVKFSRVSERRFSVSRRRSLYLDTPAAFSRDRLEEKTSELPTQLNLPPPFLHNPARAEIYSLSLHDALPICSRACPRGGFPSRGGAPCTWTRPRLPRG